MFNRELRDFQWIELLKYVEQGAGCFLVVDVQVTNKRIFAYREEMKVKFLISMEEELGYIRIVVKFEERMGKRVKVL